MKEIPLSQGKVALVDDEDYDRLVAMGKWRAIKGYQTYYAIKNSPRIKGEKRTTYYMHRVIMDCYDSKKEIDHCDFDGLNNQKSNIRIATRSDNKSNTRVRKDNVSGYTGVYPTRNKKKYVAEIKNRLGRKYLGVFEKAEDAALAYNRVAAEMYGEFACLNKIPA